MLKRRLKWEEEKTDEQYFDDEVSTSDESDSAGEEPDEGSVHPHRNVKVMILASRGINARQRHLMDDLLKLVPHCKKESKFDMKRELFVLNELAELNGCSHCLFFESRKPQELFLWFAKCPGGPSVRFHVQNIHTLEELDLKGNSMKFTRPILSFDPSFGKDEHGQVLQQLLAQIFGTPKAHRKAKPYFDHVFHFSMADDRIWFRNYQIKEDGSGETTKDGLSLAEIGPRFVLHPVRVFEGSFGGRTIHVNPNYRSASEIRAALKSQQASRHLQRVKSMQSTEIRKKDANLPEDELDKVFD